MLVVDDVKDIVILSYLSEDMQKRMLPYLDVLHFDEGETIFTEGDTADRFYFLKRGKILLEKRISDTITFAIGSVKPGYSFGWSAILALNLGYTSNTVCAEPCTVYSIRAERLRNLLESDHHMGFIFSQRLLWVVKNRLDHRTQQFVTLLRNHPDIENLI
jgi:CRP/FNR family cyclic AMP-dependent transcriptional regulator